MTAKARLEALAALGPDWNCYGSPPPAPAALARAREVLACLDSDPPVIVPVPGGGLQMEWQHGRRGLELEIRADGALEYLRVDGGAMVEGMLVGGAAGEIQGLLRWLGEAPSNDAQRDGGSSDQD